MGAVAAWPAIPDWLRVEAAPDPVRRGERVRVRWQCAPHPTPHELRLALVVHTAAPGSHGLESDGPGGLQPRAWVVRDRAALDGASGTPRLRVPSDAPFSYAGRVLAFSWGIALAPERAPSDTAVGWMPVGVVP